MTYRYDELTWPEINDAVGAGKIPVLPVGSVEQHGHHLPLKVDWFCAASVVEEAARRSDGKLLAMPPVHYGYCRHVMDFPGTIAVHPMNLINFCLDITKSVAYHGFKKVIIVNGHGSNRHLLELVARRTVLETDAVCAIVNWWDLLLAEPDFNSRWRESVYPGGCGHAGELETSVLLHLDPEAVHGDRITDNVGKGTAFHWTDLFAAGPVSIPGYHSQGTETGVGGQPSLATGEKGKVAFEGAVRLLLAFAEEFDRSPIRPRKDHHNTPPTFPVPG
jgi:creatinine amidohydrolase